MSNLLISFISFAKIIGSITTPRDPHPWITKYIFPGGYTPSLSEVSGPIEKSGLIISSDELNIINAINKIDNLDSIISKPYLIRVENI